MANKKLGGKCKAFKISALLTAVPGNAAFPTGTVIDLDRVIEISIDDSKEMADSSDRQSLVDTEEAVGRKVALDVKVHLDPANEQYRAFSDASNNGTPPAIAFYTGPKDETPGEGFAANWTVGSKGREEKRKEFVVVTFKISVHSFYGDFVVTGS